MRRVFIIIIVNYCLIFPRVKSFLLKYKLHDDEETFKQFRKSILDIDIYVFRIYVSNSDISIIAATKDLRRNCIDLFEM